jgi:hypothetical protein
MRARIAIAIALWLPAAACGDGSGAWAGVISDSAGVPVVVNPAEGSWTLQPMPTVVEELRIGSISGDAAYQFGQIASVDVDASGRIYVLDQQAAEVRVFDAEGQHERTLGRPGGGPGELSRAALAVLAGADGRVYVADVMAQRILAFGPDGSEVGSAPLAVQNGIPLRMLPAGEGRFAIQLRSMTLPGMSASVPMRDRILLRNPASESADTLVELESGGTLDFSGGTPRVRVFDPEPIWTLLGGGRVAHGRNDAFRVELRAADGALERVITRPTEPRPLAESDRSVFLEFMRRTVEQQGVPPAAADQFLSGVEFADRYPAFAALLGGPGGTLWAQRIVTAADVEAAGGTFSATDLGAPEWDVFDAEGRLLGAVRMPLRFQPLLVVGSRIYGVLRDELDVQHVVRLRIDGLGS